MCLKTLKVAKNYMIPNETERLMTYNRNKTSANNDLNQATELKGMLQW